MPKMWHSVRQPRRASTLECTEPSLRESAPSGTVIPPAASPTCTVGVSTDELSLSSGEERPATQEGMRPALALVVLLRFWYEMACWIHHVEPKAWARLICGQHRRCFLPLGHVPASAE